MILEEFRPFRSKDIAYKLASEPWEIRAYHALRAAIFCDEQRLFSDDRDLVDARAVPIVAISYLGGMPDAVVGVVRIWEDQHRQWWGGRLGTHPEHRKQGAIGKMLVRLAVRTACQRGCARFLANVQVQNVMLFERLQFRVIGRSDVFGIPHATMEADLTHYDGARA